MYSTNATLHKLIKPNRAVRTIVHTISWNGNELTLSPDARLLHGHHVVLGVGLVHVYGLRASTTTTGNDLPIHTIVALVAVGMQKDTKPDDHVKQNRLVDDNDQVLVFPRENRPLRLNRERNADSDNGDKRRAKDVDDEGPHERHERCFVDVHFDCSRVVLRRLQDRAGGLSLIPPSFSHRDVDVDADQNGDDEDGFKDVVNYGEPVAQAVDLRIAVGRDHGENEHARKDAHAELDLLLLAAQQEPHTLP